EQAVRTAGPAHRCAARRASAREERRVRLPDRRLWVWELDLSAHRRRLRGADARQGADVEYADHRSWPRARHGVSGLRAVSVADGARQPRVRTRGARTDG